jgi:Zn-dependent protease
MINHSSLIDFLAQAAILLPAFLIAVSFHEFAHALTASLLGDDTAKNRGRLTLNPLAHIDIMGLFFLLLFRIGWANPVPMNYDNFKHPRIYSILTALAGPFSNFILAFFFFVLINHFPETLFNPAVTNSLVQILSATAYVNIMLGVFNILPIPPLDGSHILTSIFINKYPRVIMWIYRYSLIILLLIFMLPPTRVMLIKLIFYTEQLIKSLVF